MRLRTYVSFQGGSGQKSQPERLELAEKQRGLVTVVPKNDEIYEAHAKERLD
jgi:hypothetical protein